MLNAQALLFDLDGTLSDPQEGITKSIAYAMERLGFIPPALSALTAFIGPPLKQCFQTLLNTEDTALVDRAVSLYRDRYISEGKGMTENAVYPEIAVVLEQLRLQGKRLYVVTSKPRGISEKIVTHFGLDKHFIKVYGSELDGTRSDKGDLIAYVLEQENLRAGHAVMIGDRKHDIIGANKNGLQSIGACWGYGSREELLNAKATALAISPQELLAIASAVNLPTR
jgi:phosphoglycolate phosphatase